VDGERLLGINRPFIDAPQAPPPSDAAAAESFALTQVRAFLQENAVPAYLVDEMLGHGSDDAYWLSNEDQKSLGFRSQSFNQFLLARCAWDDKVEQEAYAGKRSIEDLKRLFKCRDRVTLDAAHQVLLAARQQRTPRAIGAKTRKQPPQ